MAKEISFLEMFNMPAGTEDSPAWVNDFRAYVDVGQFKETKTGKTYWPLKLTNPTGSESITVNSWERPGDNWSGKLCLLSGGMLKQDYKGKAELKITSKTKVYPQIQDDGSRPISRPSDTQPIPTPRPPQQNPVNQAHSHNAGPSCQPSLSSIADLWRECWGQAMIITSQITVPDTWTAEHTQTLATTLFIEANRKGITASPTRPVNPQSMKAQSAPSPTEVVDEDVPFN